MSQLFASGGQSIGVSASASVLPMNTQDWSPFGWTGWISLQSKRLSRVPCGSAGKKSVCNVGHLGLIPGLGRSPGEGKGYSLQYSGLENSTDCIVLMVTKSQTQLSEFHFHFLFLLQHHSSKVSILRHSAFFIVQLSHPYMTTGKIIALTRQTFVGKVISLLFNMLSRLVIAFLPKSKRLLISWLQSPSAVIFVPLKIKSLTVSIISPSICHEVRIRCHDLNFLNVVF